MDRNSDADSIEFSEEELLLQEIQDQCSRFADELITLVCKRAKKTINSWGAYIFLNEDDYPSRFTNYDILACEHQTKYWDEINPFLEDAIEGALSTAYESLSPKEKFFIEYSECYYNTRFLDSTEINKLIFDRFVEMLNEHWKNSKKIQEFEERKPW